MTVKNIRFTSGENVICELNEEKEDTIVIADPDIHEIEINKRNVMYITEAVPSLVTQYNTMFNKPSIVTPNTGKLIL